MKDNILEVIIHKPINEVFIFTTDPRNTSQWIDSIAVEKTNEWPPRVGTIYENRGNSSAWTQYKVLKYDTNKEFELIKENDQLGYHVNYTYSICPDGATKLVYHEWVTAGEIDGPFTQDTLNKLKSVMEKKTNLVTDVKTSNYPLHFLKKDVPSLATSPASNSNTQLNIKK